MISGTITDMSGRTLSGQTAEAFYYSLRHARPLSIGLNCALGATELRAYVDALAQVAECYVSAHPNAGLPNAFGEYDETPEQMAATIGEFAHKRPGELRRRLLRHDAGAYPRDRRGGAWRGAAGVADASTRKQHEASALVIPAKAGIQLLIHVAIKQARLDSGFRRNDELRRIEDHE